MSNTDPPFDEKELLQRIAAGDRSAFALVYARYWNTIYSTALSFLKSPEWAQDTVQDIFLKLWTKRELLPEVEKFDAWLYVMARNTLIDQLNKKLSTTPIEARYADVLPGDLLSPDTSYSLKQTEEVLHKAIQQLPPRQKLIFQLIRQAGLTHNDVATRLRLAPGTVNNHLTRALNAIRQYLRRQNADDPAEK